MLRKVVVLGLLAVALLAACSPGAAEQEEVMAEDEMMEEESMAEDEEMMEEESMDEEEMMDEEAMDEEEMMDDEMMDDDMMMGAGVPIVVRIENVSADESMLLAPGVWVSTTDSAPLFTSGEADRGEGLEALAEDGDPGALGAALSENFFSGVFNTPSGASEPGPLAPGAAWEFAVLAAPGDHLSFATMFVQSNDLFYAPGEDGIALFDADDNLLPGDVTEQVQLWDAGTEVNEEPGAGANQAPRQSGPDTGDDENGVVQIVADGFSYPAVSDVLAVTVTPAS